MRRPISAAVSIGLIITVVIIGNTVYNAARKPKAEFAQSSASEDGNDGEVLPPCGYDWIWYHNICFYFSETEGTWTEAKDSCAALNSSLAMFDTQEELDFMLFNKGNRARWIGLERRYPDYPWLWVDGTEFNSWFTVGNYSGCAYLRHYIVRTSECYFKRKWICTKYP